MGHSRCFKYRDLASGFRLRPDNVGGAAKDRLLVSSAEWEVLAGIVLSCQNGDFTQLVRVPELMRQYNDWLFWKAASELVGYAGSCSFIEGFFEAFQGKIDDRGVQYFLAVVLADSCGLWAVEPLLTLHAAAIE